MVRQVILTDTSRKVGLVGATTDYVSMTSSNVTVQDGSKVNGTGTSDGISYTGYTYDNDKNIVKTTNGGSVTVTDSSSVTGAQNGINYTNGNVTATGTSATQLATVTGTAANGIANTSGTVSLGYATVSGATNGVSATGTDVEITDGSTVTGGTNGVSGTTGKVTVSDNSAVTGTTNGISVTGKDVSVTDSTITGTNNEGIDYTGYTAADTKSATGGSVTITGNSSVTGGTDGVNHTNGSVTVTGTSTKDATVTGTNGYGIANTVVDVKLEHGAVTGGTDGIYNTDGKVTLTDSSTVTGTTNGVNVTAGTVSVTDSKVTGTNGEGIAYTGYSSEGTKSTGGGNVVITGDSSVIGGTDGINYTNGSVTVTGTATKDVTVKGTKGYGVANTASDVKLEYADVNAGTDGVYNTDGKVTLIDSTVTGGTNGVNVTAGSVSVTDSKITGTTADGIAYTGYSSAGTKATSTGDLTITGDSSVTGGQNGINFTNGSVSVTGSSTLNKITVEGTAANGIANTIGDVDLKNTEVTGATDGIYNTEGKVTLTETTITGGTNGIEKTGGSIVLDTDTITGNGGAGIINTTGNITQAGNDSVISGTTYGITTTKGSISLSGLNKKNSTVTGGTGGIYATGGDVSLSKETVTATTGDGIKGVGGAIDISGTDIIATGADGNGITATATIDGTKYVQDGTVSIVDSTVTATNNGIDLSNSNGGKVTITDTTVTATNGFGIDATSHQSVAINGVNVTAGTKGILATTDGTVMDISTNGADHDITAGNVGVEIGGKGSQVNFTGTAPLSIEITNGGDEHTNAGIYAHDGATSNNPSMATTITIDGTAAGAKASGLIATGGSKITFSNADNVIKTATTEGTSVANVDGVYVADANSSVTMDGGAIDISATTSANGVHAVKGGSASLSNQGDNFSVAATGTGTANGVLADGTGTSVTLKNTNLKNLSSVDGDVTGLNASKSAQIGVSFTAEDKTSKEINVHATGTGSATAINAVTGADVVATGVKGITATADGTGTATGIYTNGDGSTVTVNTATDKDMGALSATSTGSAAKGIIAAAGGVNEVYGLTTIDVTGDTGATGIRADDKTTSNTVTMSSTLTATNNGKGTAFGIFANNGAANTVEGVTDITADNKGTGDAYAIAAQNSGSTNNVNETINNVTADADNEQGSVTATSTTAKAYGILSQTNGVNVVGGVTSITATGSTGAYGIRANVGTYGKTSNTVYMDDTLTATTATGEAYGIQAANFGSNKVEGVTDIEAKAITSGDVYGVSAVTKSSNDVTMTGEVMATTGTGNASGILAADQSTNKVTGVTGVAATTTKGDVRGIYALDSTNTVNGNEAKVSATTTTGEADGIVAKTTGTQAALNTVTGVTSVVASGSTDAYGIGASGKDATYTATNDVTMAGDVVANSTAKGTVAGVGAFTYGTNIVKGAVTVKASGVEGDAYGVGAATHSSNDVTMTGAVTATTGTGNASGILAVDQSTNTVDGVTGVGATTTTGDARGIYALDSTNTVNGNEAKVSATTTTGEADGIAAKTTGTKAALNTVTGVTSVEASGSTDAYGIGASGKDATYTATNDVTMAGDVVANSTAKGTVAGVGAFTYGTNIVKGAVTVKASGVEGDAYGVGAATHSSNDVTMTGAVTATTGTGNASGILAVDQSTNTVDGVTGVGATTTTGDARGIYALDSTNTVNGNEAKVSATTTTGEADGIVAKTTGTKAALNTVTGVTDVIANGSDDAYGIGASGKDATYTATNDVTMVGAISATSSKSGTVAGVGAFTYGTNVVKTATDIIATGKVGDAYGVGAATHSSNEVEMTGALSATTTSGNAYAVLANNDSTNTINGTKATNTTTPAISATTSVGNAFGAYAKGTSADTASENDITMDATTGGAISATSTANGLAMGMYAGTYGTNKAENVTGITANSQLKTAAGLVASGISASNTVNVLDTPEAGELSAKSKNSAAFGLYAFGGGTNTVGNVDDKLAGITDITATGAMGTYGIYATGQDADGKDSNNTVQMDGSLTATNTSTGIAYGIIATKAGDNVVEGVKDIKADNQDKTGTYNAYGVTAQGTGSTNKINETITEVTTENEKGSVTATTQTGAAYAIQATAGGTNTLGGVTSVDAEGVTAATGIAANDANSVNTVYMDSTVKATSVNGPATGIIATNTARNTVTGATDIEAEATTTGDARGIIAADGINEVNMDQTDTFTGHVTANATSGEADGIVAKSTGTGVAINTVGGVTYIDAEGTTSAYGIAASGYGEQLIAKNIVTMNDYIIAKSTGTGTVGAVVANNYGDNTVTKATYITAESSGTGDVYGVGASTHSSNDVTMTKTITATAAKGAASGIIAVDQSTNTVNGVTGVEATTTTGDARGIYAQDSENTVTGNNAAVSATTTTGEADGIVAKSTGTQAAVNTVTGVTDITASGSKDAYGISASGTDDTNTATNKVTMTGDVAATSTEAGTVEGVGAFTYGSNIVKGAADITASGVEGSVYGIGGSTNSSNDVTMTGSLSASASTSGDVYAVLGNDNSTNKVEGTKDISATTASGTAYGIDAVKDSTNNVNKGVTTGMGSLTVKSEDGAAYGVNADATGGTRVASNNVGGLTTIDVTGSTSADGVKAIGANSVNTVNMNGTLTATGGSRTTTAVSASNGGTDTITGVTSISAKSAGDGDVKGIVADTNGTVEVYQADGTSPVAVTAESTGSGEVTGVEATGNSTIENISDVTAKANNGSAYGVILGDGTNTIKAINNIKATSTDGYEAAGISTEGDSGNNTLAVAGNIEATNNGDGWAEGVYNSDNESLTVTVAGNVTTSAPDGNADIVYSNFGGATTDVTVKGNMSVTGNKAALAYAHDGDTVNLTGGGTTTLKGTSMAKVADVDGQSTVNLKNITVKAEGPADASYSAYSDDNGGTVNLTNTTITGNGANGGADIYYENGDSDPGEDLNVTIDGTSSITGAANAATDSAANGAINITNAGTWNVTGNSNLNASGESSLTNTGLVDMTKDGTTAEKQVSSKLAVKSLTHNGNLIMDVSPEKVTTGDQIVTTTTSGSGKIQANILASEQDATYKEFLDTALITATGTADGNYSVTNNGNNNLEVGNWTYSLQPMKQADGSTIYHLVNNDLLSNKGKTIVSSVVSPDYWYYETNALYNDINNFNGARKDHDVWAHVVHSKNTRTDVWDGTGVGDVDSQYSGVVVGIDKKFSQTAKGSFWGGIMGGYGKVSNDFVGGDADMNSAHVGIYGVYRTTTDWYVGSILKYNRYSTDLSSTTAAGTTGGVRTSDDLSQTGWGLSVMGGKRFTNKKGWFVEPQLELGYHKISDGDYTLGGSHVNVDSMTSKRVRAGFNVGKTIAYQSGANLDVFAQASLVHEFGGDGQITTTNKYYPNNGTDNLETKFDGTWGLYKFGLNYNTAKGDNGILALTYNKGSHRSSPVGFELTYNWTF
jgi:hypothetical protein